MKTRIAAIGLLLCLLVASLIWLIGSIVARPTNREVAAPRPPARLVRLQASDGTRLAASYWPSERKGGPAILLLHGINASRAMFDDQALWLNGLGYAVLALDFRGHGGSAPAQRSFGWREAGDAAAGFAFLKSRGHGRIGIIGVSMGGAAALLPPDRPLPAEAMILQAVYPDLRIAIANRLARSGSPMLVALSEPLLSYQSYLRYGIAPDSIAPREGLRRFRGAVLVIGGTDDLDTTVPDSRAMYAAAPGAKALWIVEGLDHRQVSTLWSADYRGRVRCFLARSVGEPARHVTAPQSFSPPCANSPSFWTGSSTPDRATPSSS